MVCPAKGFGFPWAQAVRLRSSLPGVRVCQPCEQTLQDAAPTRLSPVDWELDSVKGFSPVFGRLARQGFCGKEKVRALQAKPANLCLRVKELSLRTRSLGGVAAVL
jgi:hypothetical protein